MYYMHEQQAVWNSLNAIDMFILFKVRAYTNLGDLVKNVRGYLIILRNFLICLVYFFSLTTFQK